MRNISKTSVGGELITYLVDERATWKRRRRRRCPLSICVCYTVPPVKGARFGTFVSDIEALAVTHHQRFGRWPELVEIGLCADAKHPQVYIVREEYPEGAG